MIYGYARVSTKCQAKDGNSLEHQKQKLEEYGAAPIFCDAFTGKKMDRPGFDELKAVLQPGDTLVVTKLDRIARTAGEGAKFISELIDAGVKVHILNMGLMDNTPSGKLIMNIMFAFAEFERDMIVERTQEGKSIAKAKDDFREGRPKLYTPERINHAMELLESHSYKEVERITGISKSTLVREKRKRTAEAL